MPPGPLPAWWPPKVGDKLRMFDWVESGPIARLIHVVAVFEHADQTHAAIAFYGVHKQWWHYDVIDSIDTELGKYWPDGEECPRQETRDRLNAAKEKR